MSGHCTKVLPRCYLETVTRVLSEEVSSVNCDDVGERGVIRGQSPIALVNSV